METRDARAEILQSLRETASLLYNWMMENMRYGRKKLKDIVENEAEEEKEFTVQQQDDEQYDIVPKIKLVYKWKRVK